MEALTDEELGMLFWRSKLPAADWTHEAHLRVAWLTLGDHALDEAHILMRVGIIRLNAFHQLVETPLRGYHETITRVWLVLIGAARRVDPSTDSRAFLAQHPGFTRDALLHHYSRERLFSVRARAHFVDPDLEPLPTV